jgi:predicted DNA-binding transcriptional regulator AlpA
MTATPAILNHTPPASTPTAEALDISGVAQVLGISKSSAKSLAGEGILPEPNLAFGKIRRWWRCEIRAWLAAQCPPRCRWVGMRDVAIKRFLSAKGAG